ncbi:MAG: hypothetical protein HQL03_10080 [Nitrospirae bacterium]|nr:hypothetical protein [Nitrospirota bacterium]MBF0592318.1 hypothetical protein [Nitrospirota bacterium]
MMLFGLLINQAVVVEAADSSFTQADRDRILRLEIRLEDGLKALNQKIDDDLKATNQRIYDGLKAVNQRLDDNLRAINQRFDAINQKFDEIRGLMYVILSVTMSGMFVLVGFILWDRRTTLAPLARTTKELEARAEKAEKLELAIKEKAEKDPEIKEALRHAGLL